MKDLTQGSVTRHILEMSGFLAISMAFQTLYYLVDLYFVSRLGPQAIAGVAVAGNIMMVVLALTQTLGVGTTTLISHAVGRKDRPAAQTVFNQAFILSLLVGLAVVAGGFLFRLPYCRSLGADSGTTRAAAEYLFWFIPALGVQFALVALGSALRGTGIVRPTMIVQILSVLVNIVLTPVLILGWGTGRPLGVAGAALATLVSVTLAALLIVFYFLKLETYVSFDPARWRPDLKVWKSMLTIGLPAGGEFGLMGIYVGLVYWIIRPFGATAQAGFGIGGRVMQAIFLPVLAIAFAASPVAGQNYGARRAGRVRETFLSAAGLSSVLMLALALLCHLSPASLIRFFSGEPGVVSFGTEYLRIISWNFVALAFIFTSSAMFQAMGNAWPPLASSSLRLVSFALPAALLSGRPGFAIHEVWYLSVVTVAGQALVNLVLLSREFRRRLAFDETPLVPAPNLEAS